MNNLFSSLTESFARGLRFIGDFPLQDNILYNRRYRKKSENEILTKTGPLSIEIEISYDVVENKSKCVICLEKFLLFQKALLLICGHFFHKVCYKLWKETCIENNKIVTCPYCRI